jgi:hypothetical protein
VLVTTEPSIAPDVVVVVVVVVAKGSAASTNLPSWWPYSPEESRERERERKKKNVVFRKYVGHAINIYIYTKAYTHHMNILRSNIPVASGNNIPTQYIYAVVHCVECHVMSVQDPSQSSSPLGILNPL